MRIWVMRHGEAAFNTPRDSQRSLTNKGQIMSFSQGKWLAQRLYDQNVTFDKILVSPYLRAQQTLDKLLEGIQAVGFTQHFANLTKTIETWEGITPAGNVENVLSYLTFLSEEGAKNVLIISHLPLVYELTQALTAYQYSVHFYPAVIAEIEWQGKIGQLLLAMSPQD